MCGIAAIVDPAVNRAALLPAMIDVLEHRGPDERGVAGAPGCAMGHARLSIIDLSSGAQPMTDVAERYWIVYNGELYNFLELRAELERRGRVFRTHSDTEVIIAAYDEWGRDCLNKFRGMFAFALWDTRERTLFAARDLFGEKPLYYARRSDGALLIASEIDAILVTGLIERTLDLVSVDAFLAYGYVPPDRTIYRDVATLPPAHRLDWRDGNVTIESYWRPRLGTLRIGMDDAAEELRHLIGQAVKRQMIADVPVGAFLSGGLDSSTIVALMQEHSAIPVKTFSVGFGSLINELPYARAVAERYHTEHHELFLESIDVAAAIERMSAVYDEPFADSSNIPTYLISEFARRHVKVVLSGDGGDELFGGYPWHSLLVQAEHVTRSLALWVVMRIASKLLRDRNAALLRRSLVLGYAARWPDPWRADVQTHVFMSPRLRRKLWGRAVTPWSPDGGYRPDDGVAGVDRGLYFDLMHYLPGDILVKVDRAAMAHGLETRAPFLDRDLAEFALSLPSSLKVDEANGKRVLRAACERYWPPELHNRGKQGFGSPVGAWMRRPDVAALTRRVTGPKSKLRELLRGGVDEIVQRLDYRAWIVIALGAWLERREVTW
jgi:asparagine synthase (glutamine-hydrolysing)